MFQLGRASLTHFAAPAAVLACAALLPGFAQSDRKVAAGNWTVSRTPDGRPDLEGMWTNYDPTPFERLSAGEERRRDPAVHRRLANTGWSGQSPKAVDGCRSTEREGSGAAGGGG